MKIKRYLRVALAASLFFCEGAAAVRPAGAEELRIVRFGEVGGVREMYGRRDLPEKRYACVRGTGESAEPGICVRAAESHQADGEELFLGIDKGVPYGYRETPDAHRWTREQKAFADTQYLPVPLRGIKAGRILEMNAEKCPVFAYERPDGAAGKEPAAWDGIFSRQAKGVSFQSIEAWNGTRLVSLPRAGDTTYRLESLIAEKGGVWAVYVRRTRLEAGGFFSGAEWGNTALEAVFIACAS